MRASFYLIYDVFGVFRGVRFRLGTVRQSPILRVRTLLTAESFFFVSLSLSLSFSLSLCLCALFILSLSGPFDLLLPFASHSLEKAAASMKTR